MGMKKEQPLEGTRYYNIFLCAYRFLEKYVNGVPDKGYSWNWISTAQEEMDFYVLQYGNDKLVSALLKACMGELKRKMEFMTSRAVEGQPVPAMELYCDSRHSKYWADFSKFWKLFCAYYPGAAKAAKDTKEADDAYWEQFMKDAGMIGNPAKGETADRFLQDIILAGIDEIERVYKSIRKPVRAA